MSAKREGSVRAALGFLLVGILPCLALATDWGPRTDVGVAAVDTETGKVLWEAWQADDVPGDVSKEGKAAVKSLLAEPERYQPPDASELRLAKDLKIKKGWPMMAPGFGTPAVTLGKRLIYYRHPYGVIALDRDMKREVWRLLTRRGPYPSRVVETGEKLVLVQIGSHVPLTIQGALAGEDHTLPKLGPNTPKQRVAAAMLLHSHGDGYLRTQLREQVGQLRKRNDADAQMAATAIDNLLAMWPRTRDSQRLLDACVTALLQEEKGPGLAFASPATQRVLTWCLLQELIYDQTPDGYDRPGVNYSYDSRDEQPLSLAAEVRAKLVGHCRQVIAAGPEAEKPFAASVLVSGAIGWDRLTDAERKSLLLSPQPSVWRWTAMSLVKNDKRQQLIQWAPQRPADDHLDVVWILKHKKADEWSDAELAFCLACAQRTPGSIAYVLNLMCKGAVPLAFRAPIRSYLEKEIANPVVKEGGEQKAYDLFGAVYLLDSWKHADDTPLLLDYLKHPCRFEGRRSDGNVIRSYRLREHVKALLERRGVTPPPGVVYEEVVGRGKE